MGRQGPRPGVLTQENCRKVTRSVEDAEIKTNVLKQNSALLEVRRSRDLWEEVGHMRDLGDTAGGTSCPAATITMTLPLPSRSHLESTNTGASVPRMGTPVPERPELGFA